MGRGAVRTVCGDARVGAARRAADADRPIEDSGSLDGQHHLECGAAVGAPARGSVAVDSGAGCGGRPPYRSGFGGLATIDRAPLIGYRMDI